MIRKYFVRALLLSVMVFILAPIVKEVSWRASQRQEKEDHTHQILQNRVVRYSYRVQELKRGLPNRIREYGQAVKALRKARADLAAYSPGDSLPKSSTENLSPFEIARHPDDIAEPDEATAKTQVASLALIPTGGGFR